jgi:hypothetical protein
MKKNSSWFLFSLDPAADPFEIRGSEFFSQFLGGGKDV